MIEMLPVEFYPQLHEELKEWSNKNPKEESLDEKRTRLRGKSNPDCPLKPNEFAPFC